MTVRGTVNARREAVVRVTVRGAGGATAEVDAVIDTGFSGSLSLPAATVVALALPQLMGGAVTLADGSERFFETYEADVDWDGEWRRVTVYLFGGETLIGMRLMADRELRIETVPGGQVEIGPLPWEADD